MLGPYIEPDNKTWMDNRIDPKVFKEMTDNYICIWCVLLMEILFGDVK